MKLDRLKLETESQDTGQDGVVVDSPIDGTSTTSLLHSALRPGSESSQSGILLTRNDTASTTGSSSDLHTSIQSSSSSKKHGHGLPKLRSGSSHALPSIKHRSSGSESLPWTLPPHLEPVQLVELAISTAYTIPGPPINELRDVILPQMFHVGAYLHRANCRETDFHGMIEGIEMLRGRFVVRASWLANVSSQRMTWHSSHSHSDFDSRLH